MFIYCLLLLYMLKDLFLLDPKITYLNHGSFGACPRPVFEVYQSWQRQLELEPVQFLGVELDQKMYAARQKLAEYLNTSASDVVFIPNATHGVNIIARSLNLKPGDEILTTNHEYGACSFTWEYICGKSGAVYKQQPINPPFTSMEDIIDKLWIGVTSNTKAIFISHITSPTSLTMPVEKICHSAREAGIITIVDGAHAPGQMNLDLTSIGADFYTGNCHKWMLSPKGAGFIYVRPELQDHIEPLIVSWGYQSTHTAPKESRFVDYLQSSGTRDPSAALSVPAAIEFMHIHEWDKVRTSCHNILHDAIEKIYSMFEIAPLYDQESDLYQQMATISMPHVKEATQLKQRLHSDYLIEIPVIEWENHHFIRLSVQGYNSIDDIDKLIHALKILIPELTA